MSTQHGFKVVVFGGRNWRDCGTVYRVLSLVHQSRHVIEIIEGGAPGVDTFAGRWADECRVKRTTVPADWQKHGRAAGPIRNQQMVDLRPDVGIEFPGGRGTEDMRQRLQAAGIQVWQPMKRLNEVERRSGRNRGRR